MPVEGFEFGGQHYGVRGDSLDATLDIAHTTTGWSLRLRFDADLRGLCMRCLDPATDRVAVDAREVDQPGAIEDLRSPYLEGDELDVESWARDALVLSLPARIVCRDDCLGLCPVCGENLNRRAPIMCTRRARSALGGPARAPARLTAATLSVPMAVPKQRQSHSRTTSGGRSTRSPAAHLALPALPLAATASPGMPQLRPLPGP